VLLEQIIDGNKFKACADYVIDSPAFPDIVKDSIVFCKSDYLKVAFKRMAALPYKFVLITHNSDFNIRANWWNRKPPNVIKWFAHNADYRHDDLIPIPIGVDAGGVSSDMSVVMNKLREQRVEKNVAYLNINEKTNLKERKGITKRYKDKPWVTYKRNVLFEEFISDLYSHKFVISPQGNGVDCHRTWEALYVGCVPIVKKSILTESLSSLDIMIVDDFSGLDEEVLGAYVKKKNNNMLYIQYWINRNKESAKWI